MEKIRLKIVQSLQKQLGKDWGQNILAALQDKSVDQEIKSLIQQNKLKIAD